MVNREYWENIAEAIDKNEREEDGGEVSLPRPEYYISRCFEKAIALFITNRLEGASRYYRSCEAALMRANSNNETSRYNLYRLILHWLNSGQINSSILSRIMWLKQQEILQDIMEYENKFLLEIYRSCKFSKVPREEDIRQVKFRNYFTNLYPFKTIADHLVEMARYFALKGRFLGLHRVVEGAQKTYDRSLSIIPKMLSRKNRRWKSLEDKTDIYIKKNFPGQFDNYLAERELLRGDIPFYRRQGEILYNFYKRTVQPGLMSDYKDKFENFFNEEINPPAKMESRLPMLDEVTWLLLKQKFYQLERPFDSSNWAINFLQFHLG